MVRSPYGSQKRQANPYPLNLGYSSLKAALDRAWGEPTARERMLRVVLEEVER